jgi:protein-tyrosine phosphatase
MTAAPPGDPDRFRIRYVCTGNVCRSVFAERLTRAGVIARLGSLASAFDIASAGTAATPGQTMHPYVRDILRARGAASDGFASQRLTTAMVAAADVVLAAAAVDRDRAIALAPAALGRTFTIREFARLAGHASLPEPAATTGPAGLVVRARAAVAASQRMRGNVPYVDPASDDVADPVRTPAAFAACADRIALALATALDALCPQPAPLDLGVPTG